MNGARFLADEAATLALGAELAELGLASELVFLHGELGAGKTTLVRGFLRASGYAGAVKSPTYTLLETYELPGSRQSCALTPLRVYHFDFYRIVDPRELGYMGIDELMSAPAVKLVEWPTNAGDRLPEPHLDVRLDLAGAHRRAEVTDYR